MDRGAAGILRVQYRGAGTASDVWEVYNDPYHPGVVIMRRRDQPESDASSFFIDTGLLRVDLGRKEDLKRIFSGDQWLRRLQPIRPSNDSLAEEIQLPRL